jgi:hypothetical protein
MAVAGARYARERPQTPGLGKICGDRILDAMYSRMNVIATFQPRGELWVGTAAAQIDDEIARDCHCAGLICGLMNKVQHKIDACSNAGARVVLTVFNVETIFEDSSPRGDHTQLIVTQVVRGAGVSVKKTSAGSDQRSSADRD